ncbi:site-specific integrase [Saccharopolyspora sp. ID03-671]|uniref:tyrosine-type recombinase/integrase n=1 Tax=Saccharopolyspora sp. ID03-671 TaxID=3073066 RepID=UPI00324A521E
MSQEELEKEAARVLLGRLGLTAADLIGDGKRPASDICVPTFRDYLPRVAAAMSDGAQRTYGPYWSQILAAWGDRRITEPSPLELKHLAAQAKKQACNRRNSRGGQSAAEHLVSAARCMYNHAVADGWLNEAENPARRVTKPRRLPSTRRALPDSRLHEISQAAARTGNDPVLDALLIRLHIETACRRGGALNLTLRDLDPDQCLIRLHEKGETVRWQPVSPTLMTHLREHAHQRGATKPSDQLLRYHNHRPITRRRYDHLWTRIGQHLPWVHTQGVSTHWLRHTTLTWVERNFGYAVAHAYAGHHDGRSASATTTYIRADVSEVAAAVATLTGEDHPLMPTNPASQHTSTEKNLRCVDH